ncbi:hypothetical protein [Paenibacillus polymyxa]|uniref:hypothetical protein n=1 Tax=Paenibacillus polymyxa TaxID=1406 RepID=UPI002AB4DF17|nr:hypothetical protein [Paenibacillus polymyxa]MDY8023354.1 hypothetical protein [Paenibacillus polymyxa]
MKENLSGDCHRRQDEAVHYRLGNPGDEMEMFINEEVIRKKVASRKDAQQKF